MDIRKINNKLIRIYGHCQITDKPKYRVVRSETQVEKRTGSYNEFTQGTDIYLGTRQGTREIKKYWYLPPCWVLERVEPNTDRQALINEKFTYEPLLPFLDLNNQPIPLSWKPLEFLLNRLQNAERRIRSEEEDRLLEEKKQKAEEEKIFGILDSPDPVKELPTFKSSTILTGIDRSYEKVNNLYVPKS